MQIPSTLINLKDILSLKDGFIFIDSQKVKEYLHSN